MQHLNCKGDRILLDMPDFIEKILPPLGKPDFYCKSQAFFCKPRGAHCALSIKFGRYLLFFLVSFFFLSSLTPFVFAKFDISFSCSFVPYFRCRSFTLSSSFLSSFFFLFLLFWLDFYLVMKMYTV